MRLDIETVKLVDAIRDAVNSVPLEDIELYKNGKRKRLNKSAVKEWKFTDLNNWDFFNGRFNVTVLELYKRPEAQKEGM